jgi:TetR/AcrR family transcriptional regulator
MAPLSRPKGRSELRRAAILKAAEQLFAERGFASSRLEDVAERVGIRRASIFYYFPDKPALYDAVLANALDHLLMRTSAALAKRGSLSARIEAGVAAWVETLGTRPTLARLLLREAADGTSESPPALLRHTQPFVELVQRLMQESAGDPLLAAPPIDPIHLASTIVGATVFFVAAMPTLAGDRSFDPTDARELASHKNEVLRITRRLLGIPTSLPRTRKHPATRSEPASHKSPRHAG